MQNIMQVSEIDKTMSSREIAKLADKQHGHVVRDIELLNENFGSGVTIHNWRVVFYSR